MSYFFLDTFDIILLEFCHGSEIFGKRKTRDRQYRCALLRSAPNLSSIVACFLVIEDGKCIGWPLAVMQFETLNMHTDSTSVSEVAFELTH